MASEKREKAAVPATSGKRYLVEGSDVKEEYETPFHELIKSGNMVKLYVGPAKQVWFLHEDLLSHGSEYFMEAFRGDFKKATEKTIILDNEDPAIFGLFVTWLYTGDLHSVKSDSSQKKDDRPITWCYLEAFADKFWLNDLSTIAVGNWYDCYVPKYMKRSAEDIKFIYEECSEHTRLRGVASRKVMNRHYLSRKVDDYAWLGQLLACNASFAGNFAIRLKSHKLMFDNMSFCCCLNDCWLHTAGAIN
ncbi:uncharacterized protein L3040_009542 [Drepanopeziza brunnea f. sp. 'multigermtubi']|uniref:BTB domain-containing protein n=1 Tax=Marssonina brunnea f. sp. multigermtubi (strain MB_m1) TaxID=1072389 RepID=K1X6F4_MARBU|nr:uncharacterized protein MBM_05512 [Drepanopeziza brunnea f. sp. 'multigermtubi' MB_m1]EKD16218.1 hypothetical protein MBM_05512 [Drepanopeziza brunnea f. sp. 'multigermtubi' MB_m1]KAJ5032956.1 hypothetical protein L3040_009542 [Drepanopeziza brunnea f. sp. 'multigermtubi']